RHPGHSREPDHAVVLRDADHLLVSDRPRPGAAVHEFQPVRPPGDLVSGDPVLPGAVRTLEVARGARHRVHRLVPGGLLGLRSAARFVRRGSLMSAQHAIEVARVTKAYRRFTHQKQFATLKSALLTGSL